MVDQNANISGSLFQCDLISPDARLFSAPVRRISLPTQTGIITILAGHQPVLLSLSAGVVSIETEDTKIDYFITGAFADINATQCTLLAEEAIDIHLINKEETEKRIKELKEDLMIADSASESNRLRQSIMTENARLMALNHEYSYGLVV